MVKLEMKLLAPLPLCGVLMLTAGAAWFVLRNREQEPPSVKTGPHPLVADKSIRERFLAAVGDNDRIRRSARFATVFRQLTAESAAELALEFWAREKASPFQNDWYDFLRRWTELDPAGALAFAHANAGSLLEDWLLAIVPAWAGVDREAALQWWLTSAGPGREKIAAALIGGWADQDWQAAAKWVEINSQGSDQAELALAVATRAVVVDASGVQARIEARLAAGGGPTAIETALFLRLAAHRLSREGINAISWLACARSTFPCSPFIAGECETYLMAEGGRAVATNEERGTWLTWLTDVPPVGERSSSYNWGLGSGVNFFTRWLASDAESASEWLRGQHGRTGYDPLAVTLALTVAKESPDMAAAWALTVGQDLRRYMWREWQVYQLPVTPEIAAAIQREDPLAGIRGVDPFARIEGKDPFRINETPARATAVPPPE